MPMAEYVSGVTGGHGRIRKIVKFDYDLLSYFTMFIHIQAIFNIIVNNCLFINKSKTHQYLIQ